MPVYDLYRDGLFLSDYQINMPDSLRTKLSSKELSNLFSVGFQLEKVDYKLRRYSNVLCDSLNKAFKLNAKFVLKDDSVIVIKKINEGKSITKSLWYNMNLKNVKGDSLIFKGQNSKNLCAVMGLYMNMIFVTESKSNTTYDGQLVLNLKSTNRREIQKQLAKHGIESEVRLQKQYFLEF